MPARSEEGVMVERSVSRNRNAARRSRSGSGLHRTERSTFSARRSTSARRFIGVSDLGYGRASESLREWENRSFTPPIGVLRALRTSFSIESESLREASVELCRSRKIAVQTKKTGVESAKSWFWQRRVRQIRLSRCSLRRALIPGSTRSGSVGQTHRRAMSRLGRNEKSTQAPAVRRRRKIRRADVEWGISSSSPCLSASSCDFRRCWPPRPPPDHPGFAIITTDNEWIVWRINRYDRR
jgi:hypothetical protein